MSTYWLVGRSHVLPLVVPISAAFNQRVVQSSLHTTTHTNGSFSQPRTATVVITNEIQRESVLLVVLLSSCPDFACVPVLPFPKTASRAIQPLVIEWRREVCGKPSFFDCCTRKEASPASARGSQGLNKYEDVYFCMSK